MGWICLRFDGLQSILLSSETKEVRLSDFSVEGRLTAESEEVRVSSSSLSETEEVRVGGSLSEAEEVGVTAT